MGDEATEQWVIDTQGTLGKLISKPKMTEKYLRKPPFRFLHDIVMEVVRTTTFAEGLYSPEESDAGSLADKQAKVDFLNKAISVVSFALGEKIDVSSNKIVAGLEAEKTNVLLQKLHQAATTCVGAKSAEAVQRIHNGETAAEKPKKAKKPKEEDAGAAAAAPAAAPAAEGAAPAAASAGPTPEEEEAKKEEERKRKAEKAEKKKREEEKRQRAEEEAKAAAAASAATATAVASASPAEEDAQRQAQAEAEAAAAAAAEAEKKAKEEEKRRRKEEEKKKRHEEEEKRKRLEEEELLQRRQAEEAAAAAARAEEERAAAAAQPQAAYRQDPQSDGEPASVPGSAAQPNRPAQAADTRPAPEPGMDEAAMAQAASPQGGEDLGASMVRPRPDRPRTAGRKPPKVTSKVKTVADEPPAQDVPPPTIIAEGAKDDSGDEDIFEAPQEKFGVQKALKVEEGEVHGKLVRDLLSEKQQEEEKERLRKEEEDTREEVEEESKGIRMGKLKRPKKGQEASINEIDIRKLNESIQKLCEAANPLGKSIDLVHQDIASMGKELDHWRQEYRDASEQYQQELKQTEELVQPLYQKLAELDDKIAEQRSKIRNSRSRIAKGDVKIKSLLESVVLAK